MARGFHLADIGTKRLSWAEFRTLLEWGFPPTPDSAFYRARNPKSWHWKPEFDLYALIIYTLQGANWQRAGGKGDKPELITRPVEAYENQNTAGDDGYDLSNIRAELERRKNRSGNTEH